MALSTISLPCRFRSRVLSSPQLRFCFARGPSNEAPPALAMCCYFILKLLGHLPGPSPRGQVTGWFMVFAQWLYLPEALLLRQVAPACCWQLPPVLWLAALRLVASQLDAFGWHNKARLLGACGLWAGTCVCFRSAGRLPALLLIVHRWFDNSLAL